MGAEELAPLKAGEVLVRVEAAGLNHAETLIRSGNYTVRLPFPHAVGGEGSGTDVAAGPEVAAAALPAASDASQPPISMVVYSPYIILATNYAFL